MTDIYDYLDYREFLHDFYEASKKQKSWFSLRYFGSKIGLNASYLLRIMQKQEQLSCGKVPSIAFFCGFTPRQTSYFEAMVRFSRAKTESEAEAHFKRMMDHKGVRSHLLDPLQFEYYSKWYYSALLSVIGFFEVSNNYRELGKKLNPQISSRMAREAVELLLRLGLVRRTKSGVLERTHQHISSGEKVKSLAVRGFQKEMIRLSEEAIERFPRETRDISTLTVNMKKETLADIREILQHCRQAIIKRVAEDKETDCAYQVNMQTFPLTDVTANKGERS